MPSQRPIFNRGLFGRANAEVCNLWTDSASMVSENAEGIRWATDQLQRVTPANTWLAKTTAAVQITPNRWKYRFEPFTINVTTALPVSVPGEFGKSPSTTNPEDYAYNIRELRNTSTTVDGSPLTTGASIGPVGSSVLENGQWNLQLLEGYVWMHVEYDIEGKSLFWFDATNPINCFQEQE
jgi:hypothetical protein